LAILGISKAFDFRLAYNQPKCVALRVPTHKKMQYHIAIVRFGGLYHVSCDNGVPRPSAGPDLGGSEV